MRWQVAGAFGPAAPGCRWRRVSVTIRNRMAARNVLIGVLSTLAASLTCVAQSLHSAARAARPTGSETLLVFPLENSSRLAKLEWLGEGLAELTIERLSHAGQFAFPREERLAAIEKLGRSEEHTSELQSPCNLVCRLLLEKKKKNNCTSELIMTGRSVSHRQRITE